MKSEYLRIRTEKGELYGGNQSMFGRLRHHSGCGMIAACDVALYLNGRRSVTLEEYRKTVLESRFYRFAPRLFGIPARAVVRYLNKHVQGHTFRAVPSRRLPDGRLAELVSQSLDMDIPVIVRVGLNGKKLPYKICFPLNGKRGQGEMSWHYFTITGLENGTVFFSSWGGTGEMSIADLEHNSGLFGVVIVPDEIT